MKKIEFKSLILGFIIGTLTITSVAATTISIKTAQYNNTKVIFNGNEMKLSQPAITVINEGSQYGSNYIPIRTVLENMGYNVEWDGKNNAVIINEVVVNGGEDIVKDSTIDIQDNIIEKYSDFFSNFEVEMFEFDNIYTWKLYYKGELSSEELRHNWNNEINIKAIVKDLFESMIKDSNGCMMFVYYDKQYRNVLITAEYTKNNNQTIYDYSGIE